MQQIDLHDLREPGKEFSLKPGDHLIYGRTGLFSFGTLINIKTASPASHIEIYAGNGMSIASRDNLGVNCYSLRINQLIAVLRPNGSYAFEHGMAWFGTVRGQKYDWKGILCFALADWQGAQDRMFCSEFATRFDRQCGFFPFEEFVNADRVSPADFLKSGAFVPIYTNFQKGWFQ